VGVAEEEDVRSGRPGPGNGGVAAGLDAPQVPVGQEVICLMEGTVVQPSQLPGTMQMGSLE